MRVIVFGAGKARSLGKLLGLFLGITLSTGLLTGCSSTQGAANPIRTPVDGGSFSTAPAGSRPATESPRQVGSNGGNSNNSPRSEDARKAELQRLQDQLDAETAAQAKKAAEDAAALEAARAHKEELYNNMIAADNEVSASRANLAYWEHQVNDFAARGMLQSGAGAQAMSNYNAAQPRLDAALAAQADATAAYNAAPG